MFSMTLLVDMSSAHPPHVLRSGRLSSAQPVSRQNVAKSQRNQTNFQDLVTCFLDFKEVRHVFHDTPCGHVLRGKQHHPHVLRDR